MARGATASGGQTIAPKVKHGHAKPYSQWVAAATAIIVNVTDPMASSEMGRRLKWNSRQLIATADE